MSYGRTWWSPTRRLGPATSRRLAGGSSTWTGRSAGPAAITRYIVQRQGEEAANGTVNREVAVLLRMLRLGLERGMVARLPIVHKPKEAAPRAGFFEADAFAAVRKHLPADLQVAVTVAYTFGWRMQSEVLALQTRQLDLAAGTNPARPGQHQRTTRGGWCT